MHLNKSVEWKLARLQIDEKKELFEIAYKGKSYLGCYLTGPTTLATLKEHFLHITAKLQSYCPNYVSDAINSKIFALLLIS